MEEDIFNLAGGNLPKGISSLKALTPAQPTKPPTHFPMMLPVCYSLKSIGLDTDTNTFSNVATSLLTSIFEKQFSF